MKIAEILVNNYYPFGILQPGRYWQSGNYRYGFNSMEKDDEIKGVGGYRKEKMRKIEKRIKNNLKIWRICYEKVILYVCIAFNSYCLELMW